MWPKKFLRITNEPPTLESPASPDPPSVDMEMAQENGHCFSSPGFTPVERSALEDGECQSTPTGRRMKREPPKQEKPQLDDSLLFGKGRLVIADCSPVPPERSESSESSKSSSDGRRHTAKRSPLRKRRPPRRSPPAPVKRRRRFSTSPRVRSPRRFPCPESECGRWLTSRERLCCHLFADHRLPMCCAYCNRHFHSTRALMEHVRNGHFHNQHHDLDCWFCPEHFTNIKVFWSHMWMTHRKGMRRCERCNLVCMSPEAFNCHRSICDNSRDVVPIYKERERLMSAGSDSGHSEGPRPLMSTPVQPPSTEPVVPPEQGMPPMPMAPCPWFPFFNWPGYWFDPSMYGPGPPAMQNGPGAVDTNVREAIDAKDPRLRKKEDCGPPAPLVLKQEERTTKTQVVHRVESTVKSVKVKLERPVEMESKSPAVQKARPVLTTKRSSALMPAKPSHDPKSLAVPIKPKNPVPNRGLTSQTLRTKAAESAKKTETKAPVAAKSASTTKNEAVSVKAEIVTAKKPLPQSPPEAPVTKERVEKEPASEQQTQETGYVCEICDHFTQWKKAAYEHLRKVHQVPPARCPRFVQLRLASSVHDGKESLPFGNKTVASREKPDPQITPLPTRRILPKEPELKKEAPSVEAEEQGELEEARSELRGMRQELDNIKQVVFGRAKSVPHHALPMAANVPPTESEQRVVNEFSQLLDKSKQLFNGIRDLPQHGTKQWQGYFGRTFDVYTRLWKFQQQHRLVLDTHFGLKRWQIGEIASKIGQLYYHYYLRTSETSYLLETFSFYSAIRSRAYYSRTSQEDKPRCRPDLTVKKLRYYARFIVVCLLLKKLKLVRDLVRELSAQVEEYIGTYDPEDQLEWSLILTEIKSFVEADNIVSIVDVDNSTVILSHRLTPYNTPPLEQGVPFWCSLQEVLIVGNCANQVKCTELSLDMFWMLQALEREPHEELTAGDDAFTRAGGKDNPHKYLLYKPTFAQLLLFLSSGFRELPPNGAMLLYISADGAFSATHKRMGSQAYDMGGLAANSRKEAIEQQQQQHHDMRKTSNPTAREMHCIHPGDLYLFLRKPFFVIIDSENSSVFLGLPNLFGQPCVTLVSPVDIPPYLLEQPKRGSIFTLFLHSPLTAFCYVCNISEIPIALWDKCQAHIDKFICDAGRLLVRSQSVDRSYIEFYGDDFLRLLILRFIFCSSTLRLHRNFRGNPAFHPHCHPPIPDAEVTQHPSLTRLVLDLACILDVLSAFRDSEETVC